MKTAIKTEFVCVKPRSKEAIEMEEILYREYSFYLINSNFSL